MSCKFHVILNMDYNLLLMSHQLKATHASINLWRGKLGVHWDDNDGCCVGPEVEAVWEVHLQVAVSVFI